MKSYRFKRPFDLGVAMMVLVLSSPVMGGALLAVYLQDGHSPFYRASRVARGGGDFLMTKIRSMVIGASRSGVNSTSSDDTRITRVGTFIRRFKIDEISQFLNVLSGTMSVVGPRPQVRHWGTDLYTSEENRLLSVRPGITDLASIVFADEGDILTGAENADLTYNQIIRPWKSRLGLFYIDHQSLRLDVEIVWLTILTLVSRTRALDGVITVLVRAAAPLDLVEVCRRTSPLRPAPPPGASEIETGKRELNRG